MMLLTEDDKTALPELYATDDQGDQAQAQVKFFSPDAQWMWYATEFDGEDMFFGLVVGQEIELGYFSLSELQSIRAPWGLPIERDRHFAPKTIGELKTMHRKMRGEY